MKIFREKGKSAMVTTEVAITVALTAVVAVVAIGMFNDNLKEMISSGNFKNIFNMTGEKTSYSAFNRDYTDSQINVQIMGEQGLEMLRQKANNKVLDIIQDNPSAKDSDSVGYLVLAIESIVGKPDICVRMKKESKAECNDKDANIGGYTYKVDIAPVSSGLVFLTKANEDGTEVRPTKKIKFNMTSDASSIFGSSVQRAMGLGYDRKGKFDDKFKFIKDLSLSSKPYVHPDALLINFYDTKTSEYKKMTIEEEKTAIKTLLNSLSYTIGKAHSNCSTYIPLGIDLNVSKGGAGCGPAFDPGKLFGGENDEEFVGKGERDDIIDWAESLSKAISAYNGTDAAAIINILTKDNKLQSAIRILSNDRINKPTSCEIYNNGLNDLVNTLNLDIKIPQCAPVDN